MKKSEEQSSVKIEVVNEDKTKDSFTALKIVERTLRKIPNEGRQYAREI